MKSIRIAQAVLMITLPVLPSPRVYSGVHSTLLLQKSFPNNQAISLWLILIPEMLKLTAGAGT